MFCNYLMKATKILSCLSLKLKLQLLQRQRKSSKVRDLEVVFNLNHQGNNLLVARREEEQLINNTMGSNSFHLLANKKKVKPLL